MHTSKHPKGVCMRCGFKFDLHRLTKEWTGLRVCKDCRDPRPPETVPIHLGPEGLPKPNASPEPEPVFITPGVNDITEDDL